jgi:hypothetical protein
MPFIGNQPAEAFSSFQKQDFTTSATTSYTLNHPVANGNEIALFINFVRQEPTTAYSASGTSLTLTSATTSSDDMYCVYLGKAVQTVNPPNSSVGSSQVSADLITGQTALGATPADTDELLISDAGTLKRVDYSYLKSVNTPAFSAYLSSAQTISDATTTKAQIDTTIVDTDSGFDTSTNYRYTVPTGKGGKYLVSFGIGARSTNNDIFVAEGFLYKNGSQFALCSMNNNLASNAAHRSLGLSSGFFVMDLSAGDYLEVFAYIDCTSPPSGFPTISSATNAKLCFLSGMRIAE